MGLVSAVGLGVALGLSIPIGVIEGDGSLLMGFSIVPTLGINAPKNLTVILLDNRQHASAAGMDSQAAAFDPRSSPLKDSRSKLSMSEGEEELEKEPPSRSRKSDQFTMIVAKIEPGNEPGIPFLLEDPAVISRRFSDWLAAHAS